MNYLLTKFFGLMFGINKVLAQTKIGGPLPEGKTYFLPNPLGLTNITDIIKKVAGYLTKDIAPPIVAIMILIAGFYFLTAGDKPERIITAKQIILWTVIGYAIILISWGITSIIAELLGGVVTTPVPPYLENYPFTLPT